MSELEFLGALHVELLRHRELRPEHPDHELFQTSTVEALLAGAFEGDVTLRDLLEHGDLGLGTLNRIDGELIVLDGRAWKAELDGTLSTPELSTKTPYAVVVRFSPGPRVHLRGPFGEAELERRLRERVAAAPRPTAIRIDGRFGAVRVRSVPKQSPPYPPLAEVIAHQQITDLAGVTGPGVIEVPLAATALPAGAPAEAWAHLALYQARRDAGAIARAQPPSAFAAAAVTTALPALHGQGAWLGASVPVHDSALPLRSAELAALAARSLPEGEALLLRGNGALTLGATPGIAVTRMWLLSVACDAFLAARPAGPVQPLSAAEITS